MQIKVVWRLPLFINGSIRFEHSWDGQRYYKCTVCRNESRFDPVFFPKAPKFCPFCNQKRRMVNVVHASQIDLSCKDCGHQQKLLSTEFEELRCDKCLSTNIYVKHNGFNPPFPAKFGDAIHHYTWGDDCNADMNRLMEEFKSGSNFVPDLPGQMLSFIRFVKRLEQFSYAGNPDDRCAVINVEANLWRDYFRRSHIAGAGIEAVERFEDALLLTQRPLMKAAIEHNIAMAIYSLLAKLPENLIELLYQRHNLRDRGISAAKSALNGYSTINGFASRDRDMARVYYLMGDLLSAGDDRPNEAIREAISNYNRALSLYNSEHHFVINIQVSKVNAIWKLSEPTDEEQKEAFKLLKAAVSKPETDRLWPEQHLPRIMLGKYYFDLGNFKAACNELEQAASLVLEDINNSDDETALHARTKDYLQVFSALTRVYGILNRPMEALAAMDSLRAATIRFCTLSEEEMVERATKKGYARTSRLISGKSFKTKWQSRDTKERLLKCRKVLLNTAIVSIDIFEGTVTVVLDAPGRAFGRNLLVTSRNLEPSEVTSFFSMHLRYGQDITESSFFRENKLNKYFQLANSVLFAPLRKRLTELRITDVLAVVPGPLYGVPIDIESADDGMMTASKIRVRYIPSLGVAADLVDRYSKGNGRLLIVGYSSDDLPQVNEEVELISGVWGGDTKVMHRTGLTKLDVLRELNNEYQFVHFCCHGSFDAIMPERSALHFSNTDDNDSVRITAGDLRTCKLESTSLVTLSACSSGVCSQDAGNDLFGLTGSLLRSGVKAVVGSRWEVYDKFATKFMVALYTELRKTESKPSQAFHATRLLLSKNEKLENWAAFSFTGL